MKCFDCTKKSGFVLIAYAKKCRHLLCRHRYYFRLYYASDFSISFSLRENLILEFSLSRSATSTSPFLMVMFRISSASGSSRIFLDGTVQRPCAKLRIVSFIGNKSFCRFCKLQAETQYSQAFQHTLHQDINDVEDMCFVERIEHNHIINPV